MVGVGFLWCLGVLVINGSVRVGFGCLVGLGCFVGLASVGRGVGKSEVGMAVVEVGRGSIKVG